MKEELPIPNAGVGISLDCPQEAMRRHDLLDLAPIAVAQKSHNMHRAFRQVACFAGTAGKTETKLVTSVFVVLGILLAQLPVANKLAYEERSDRGVIAPAIGRLERS